MAYIFVGGFGDGPTGHRIVYDYAQGFGQSHADVHYFNWDQHKAIVDQIGKIASASRVLLIGHSYGGDTAGNVVAHLSRKADLLITIDPVGHTGRSAYHQMRGNAVVWVDVNAKAPSWSNFSNWIAGLGDAWDDDVKDLATYYIEAPFDHEQFSQLMNAAGDVGVSAANILDRADS